jgi:hypothetical protein
MTISKTYLLLAVMVSSLTTACNRMPPECADPRVLDTLKSVEADMLQRETKLTHVKFTIDRFEASDPHTLAVDEKLRTRSCVVGMKYRVTDEALALWNAPIEDPRINAIARVFSKAIPLVAAADSLEDGTRPMDQDMVNLTMNAIAAEAKDKLAPLGGVGNQRLSLSDSTVSYTVRMSEDRSKSSSYIVETTLSKAVTEAIGLVESFAEIAASGGTPTTRPAGISPSRP